MSQRSEGTAGRLAFSNGKRRAHLSGQPSLPAARRITAVIGCAERSGFAHFGAHLPPPSACRLGGRGDLMDGLGLARGAVDRLCSHAVSDCRAPGGAPPRWGGGGVQDDRRSRRTLLELCGGVQTDREAHRFGVGSAAEPATAACRALTAAAQRPGLSCGGPWIGR